MKTIKVILIAVIVACFGISYAQTEQNPPTTEQVTSSFDVVKIPFREAIQMKGLPEAMAVQVDPDILLQDKEDPLVARVVFGRTIYLVEGTRREWVNFFWFD